MTTISQRVVWTLLPNGFSANGKVLKASILVSPRLTLPAGVTPQNLTHFPDWQSWPDVVAHANFSLSINGGPLHSLKLASKPDRDVWAALFPPTTFVKSYSFTDMRGKVILSYPVTAIARQIEQVYGALGAKADGGLPHRAELQRHLGDGKPRPVDEVLRMLRAESNGRARTPATAAGNSPIRQPGAGIDLMAAYHTPLEQEIPQGYPRKGKVGTKESVVWSTRKRTALPKAADFQNLIDFHQIVASLAQYSELSHMAGLVIPVEFDAVLLPAGDHTLQLTVDWPKSGAGGVTTDPDIVPAIMARLQGDSFIAAPKSAASPIAGRFLKLQSSGFDLIEMDVDGAGMKLKNLMTNLARPQPVSYDDESFNPQDTPEPTAAPPSLRSAGVMLAQERRDVAIQGMFETSGNLQDTLTSNLALPTLYADDVIRGYRVDIRDDATKKWRSLCSRQIDFTFVNNHKTHTTPQEEGMIRLAAASSADGSNPDIIKIHEGLFAWKGWSLSAPEPGKILQPDETVNSTQEAPPPGLPLKTTFTATKGSLPQLRFGKSYTVRVRLVDLAGESTPFSTLDIQTPDALSNPVVYRRYEPVESPSLVLVQGAGGLESPGDGESMERIAIRTFNETYNAFPPDPSGGSRRARRHLVAPRSTHRFAEQHGVMDTPAGKIDPSLWTMLAKMDQPLAEVILKSPGPKPTSKAVEVKYSAAPLGFDLPYLPDPFAIGVAIWIAGADGVTPTVVHKIPFYAAGFDATFDYNAVANWPNAKPFTIVATDEALPDATWDAAKREFKVPMRRAERARVRISCLLPAKSLLKFAASQMIADQKPTPQVTAGLLVLIANGQHWMYTPWRTIELVHAVQKPLVQPDIKAMGLSRELFNVAARPTIRTPVHGKSTSKLDLFAKWNDPLDDPGVAKSKDGPVALPHEAHVFDVPVARNAPAILSITGKDHVFVDTRYRRVTYGLEATTRYREFMPSDVRADDKRLKIASDPHRTWVPNVAPPAAPNLLYVVPTFGWTRQNNGGQTTSMRAGGGLRVYMDRPWFTTGFGEMLGVVLPSAAAAKSQMWAGGQGPLLDFDDIYRTSVTQWGTDPIWVSGRIKTPAPANSAFPLAKWRPPIAYDGTGLPAEEGTDLPPGDFQVTDLPHPEHPDHTLNVAPHQVGYDSDRDLWYADIVVRPPSNTYYPFIRLALARYHPVSEPGAHLSHILMAEFQQLTPDRLAIVTRNPGGQVAHVAVYGSGVQESFENMPIAGQFLVDTQVLDAGGDPDLGWRSVDASANPAPAVSDIKPSFTTQSLTLDTSATPATALQAQALQMVNTENFRALLARPDLVLALQPPLLWQADVPLPAQPSGGRRRLVITENETYLSSPEALVPPPPGTPVFRPPVSMSSRVVYLETLDV